MQIEINDLKLVPLYILAIAILMNVCSRNQTEPMSAKDYQVISHTVVIDTVPFHVAVPYQVPVEVTVPQFVTYHDTVFDTIYKTYEYNNPYEDSLIAGTIFSRVKTDGTLVEQNLTYTPKFPKYIYRTDSVTLLKPEEKRNKVFIGLDAGIASNYFLVKPKVEFMTKQELKFELGYDIINKGYHVGVSKKISFKNAK